MHEETNRVAMVPMVTRQRENEARKTVMAIPVPVRNKKCNKVACCTTRVREMAKFWSDTIENLQVECIPSVMLLQVLGEKPVLTTDDDRYTL